MSPEMKIRPILVTLIMTMQAHKKDYCWPAQKTISKNLKKYHREDKSLRTLNRWLRVGDDTDFLNRKRRGYTHPVLGNIYQSTMYFLTKKALWLLERGGMRAFKIMKAIRKAMREKKINRRGEYGKDSFLPGVAPLKDLVGEILKCPDIAEHVGSSK